MFDIDDASLEELESAANGNEPSYPTMPEAGAPIPPGPAMPMPVVQGPIPGGSALVMPSPGGGDSSLRAGAAKALVGATVAMLLGAWVAGPRGAAAGVSLVGTLRNANRARKTFTDPNPEVRVEAGKSATMAVFGLGITGMLLYHEWKARNE